MKIGFIASGGGSALNHILAISKSINPHLTFYGFSDRVCGAYKVLTQHCSETFLFESADNHLISDAAARFFLDCECDLIILAYSRLITKDLFAKIRCINIHPSLLPNYTGFRAIERAFADNTESLGVTLHQVDQSIDLGEIVCQINTTP